MRKALSVAAATVIAVTGTAAPASAATGSFPWDATVTVGIDSRNWTQIAGNTTIVSKFPCWNDQVDYYYMELYLNKTLGDKSYGRVKYYCGSNQTYTWKNLPKGTYHFYMSKATDGIKVKGSGTVTYPST